MIGDATTSPSETSGIEVESDSIESGRLHFGNAEGRPDDRPHGRLRFSRFDKAERSAGQGAEPVALDAAVGELSVGLTLDRAGWLVLIETGGNQRYIFGTNRLIENLGASDLLYRSCVDWVEEATSDEQEFVRLTVTSGRALTWCRTLESALAMVETVTFRSLREAPGLIVSAAIEEWTPGGDLARTFGVLTRRCEEAAGASGGGVSRFLRYPVVEPCSSTGLPAETVLSFGGGEDREERPVSDVVRAKRSAAETARQRLADTFGVTLPQNLGELEQLLRSSGEIGWMAVIHADGNGVGQAFINLARWVHLASGRPEGESTASEFVDAYQLLSSSLQRASDDALRDAATSVQPSLSGAQNSLPIVPIVFGGDDLGVVMDAELALDFVERFAVEFEAKTSVALERVWSVIFGDRDRPSNLPNRFSLGAGIAIVKPHFPFHAAYRLAEDLADRAKRAAKRALEPWEVPPATIDFHMLSDSVETTIDGVEEVRSGVRDGLVLRGGPYLVMPSDPEASASPVSVGAVAGMRTIEELRRGITDAGRRIDGRRVVSATSLNKLRSAAFVGRAEVEITNSYLDRPVPDSILAWVESVDGEPASTMLMDVIDVVDLWGAR